MRIVAIIEARMGSSRLPGKVLMPAGGKPLLEILIERLRKTPRLDDIVVATTEKPADDPIAAVARRVGVGCFRGSEEDVLGRVLGAARAFRADVIVEITGDCPLVDPGIVQRCIDVYLEGGADYVSNLLQASYPPGVDARVFSIEILEEADRLCSHEDREHVARYIWQRPAKYRLRNVPAPPDHAWPEVHIELDTMEDYRLIRSVYEALHARKPDFGVGEMIAYLRAHPELAEFNKGVQRKYSEIG